MNDRISIDGASATGKTSLGHWLADELRVPFIDTGLTYRVLAFATVQRGSRLSTRDVVEALEQVHHEAYAPWGGATRERVVLGGVDVTHLIWSEACNGVLPWLTEDPSVRAEILRYHQALCDDRSFIVAGRDIATTLMTEARVNIVLTADFQVRRARRRRQIEDGGWGTPIVGASSQQDLATIRAVTARPSALLIDTSALSLEDVRRIVWERLQTA